MPQWRFPNPNPPVHILNLIPCTPAIHPCTSAIHPCTSATHPMHICNPPHAHLQPAPLTIHPCTSATCPSCRREPSYCAPPPDSSAPPHPSAVLSWVPGIGLCGSICKPGLAGHVTSQGCGRDESILPSRPQARAREKSMIKDRKMGDVNEIRKRKSSALQNLAGSHNRAGLPPRLVFIFLKSQTRILATTRYGSP